MILDSSAIVAMIRQENGHGALSEAIERAAEVGIGAPTLTETAIVLGRRLGAVRGQLRLSRFLAERDIAVIPFDDRHWEVANEAYNRFGKGRHPAGLNYGDCMAYATARLADAPLLFVGGDFAQTDLRPAL